MAVVGFCQGIELQRCRGLIMLLDKRKMGHQGYGLTNESTCFVLLEHQRILGRQTRSF